MLSATQTLCTQTHLESERKKKTCKWTARRDVNKQSTGVRLRGRGAQARQASKPEQRKEEGWGRKARRREERDKEAAFWPHLPSTTEGAQPSPGSRGWKGFGVSTCSFRSLPNTNPNGPPTHDKDPPFSPLIPAQCHAPKHIFSHSLIARLLASHPLTAEHWAAACETQGSPWAQS